MAEPLNGPIIVEAVEEITGADRFVVDRLLFRKVLRLGWSRQPARTRWRPADFSRLSAHFPSAMPGYARQPECTNPGEDA
ncbi:MAG: hypothetical protein ABSA93_14255, partial [Streptosporangiaceae bacterium]